MIVFIDDSGLSERPTQVRTWAPKGCTPVVQFHFYWKHVSAIAGLTRANFLFRLYDSAVRSAQIVEFLKALRTQLTRKLLIVWDGAAQHKSRIVREYLDSTKGAIQMALLPGYSPDLNPVEYLWARLKRWATAALTRGRSRALQRHSSDVGGRLELMPRRLRELAVKLPVDRSSS